MNPIDEMIRNIAESKTPDNLSVSVSIENRKGLPGLDVRMTGTTTGILTAFGAMISGMKQANIPATVIRLVMEEVLSDKSL